MAMEQEKLNQLLLKLESLQKKQSTFSKELFDLRKEINALKALSSNEVVATPIITKEAITEEEEEPQVSEVQKETQNTTAENESINKPIAQPETPIQVKPSLRQSRKPSRQRDTKIKSDLEKFIGENLISKIGIIITIIGVAIGAKYTIEHNLISPLTRIILGYLTGGALLLFGMKLKSKYESYSAVLVSGAMTIMYFITFAAYSFYGLIPQTLTFVLMLVFTVFTVIAALNYKQVIIAQLGLVGAYAVPFLLSNGSGRAEVLFTYVAIINMGILFVSFKKYWKSLFYSSFAMTWIIFISWFVVKYRMDLHFGIAFTFITVTFLTFYATYLAYKIIQKKTFELSDVVLILLNSFIFFGFGYGLLSMHGMGKDLMGLFALLNALIHFVVSVVIFKQKLADKNLFFLVSGLVLTFLTIAIPIQLDGNWVTLLWAGEAAVLCWIGRARNVRIYEKLSYPVMVLAFFSLVQDWMNAYGHAYWNHKNHFEPIINVHCLSSILFIAAFSFIAYLLFKNKEQDKDNNLYQLAKVVIPSILIAVSFSAFALELNEYWDLRIVKASQINYTASSENLRSFQNIWLVNYTLIFFSLLSFINIFKIRNKRLGLVNLILNALSIFLFLVIGLYEYSELRESYIAINDKSIFYLGIRYLSFGFAAVLIWLTHLYSKRMFKDQQIKRLFELIFHVIIVWVLSSELLHWMDLGHTDKNYKLGLSILWGVYSLMLIGIGIWKNKQHLRIGAMVLFGVTLLKLFVYDLQNLNTISKTIVFVSLGVLLLIISFLYNKYSGIINTKEEKHED